MPREVLVHCIMWTAVCLFGTFIMALEGRPWLALLCAALAVLWWPSRWWYWRRYYRQEEAQRDNDNSGI